MFLLSLTFLLTSSYELTLPAYQTYCIGEDLTSDTLLVTKFKTLEHIQGSFTLKITDTENKELHKAERVREDKHTFVSTINGPHHFCLINNDISQLVIEFEIATGVAAKDFSELPQAKDIKESERRVLKVKDSIKELQNELKAIKERDVQMTNTNETIGNRVVSYSLLTVGMLVVLAAVQTLYLKRFLRNKKMI